MIHDKWFIGCTHFFHENTFLKFKKDDGTPLRPFTSIVEMNEYMIEKWNSVVKDNDYVYHLGDVTFRNDGAFNELMHRLKGKKRLIIGNHDNIWHPSLINNFEKADLWKRFKEGNFTCTHIPQRLESLRDGAFNVHAHIHYKKMQDPHYINVCVEVRDYTPVNYDTILEEIGRV
jgi:calcineurin-like phosphoesterase family protein